MPADTTATTATKPPMIWDPLVRVFHWTLLLCVAGAFVLGHFGPLEMTLHFYLGYAVLALLAIRLIWGFVGTKNARFGNFVRGPISVVRYLLTLPSRNPSHAEGHNPLGGWSVVAMMVVLFLQVLTGLCTDPDDYLNIGPLAPYLPDGWPRMALGWHHKLGWVLLALIALHVGAIYFYKVWKREDLVTPMITGRRRG
ncbi:cytochrome b [Rhodobacter sp. JA431]|uniref:cytochrome b/b6 domain-containing protein n=1 Tax=Rhodobacter sp. JA431 TaxID=570013 RepID=UPI000BCE1B49|nr:cytochrome b/b6 domain-containing protein [Rhodobacter sp. JA431]SOB93024.1 cytochrome b [Rhodobacter sp. JA431]